jgi:hypothetical protein
MFVGEVELSDAEFSMLRGIIGDHEDPYMYDSYPLTGEALAFAMTVLDGRFASSEYTYFLESSASYQPTDMNNGAQGEEGTQPDGTS